LILHLNHLQLLLQEEVVAAVVAAVPPHQKPLEAAEEVAEVEI